MPSAEARTDVIDARGKSRNYALNGYNVNVPLSSINPFSPGTVGMKKEVDWRVMSLSIQYTCTGWG